MFKRIRSLLALRQLSYDHKGKINAIQKMLDIRVYNPAIFLKALRHRSFVAEKKMSASESYEQLEFIGDAVLDLVVSELIFLKYPEAAEGELTQLRSRLVNGRMLADIGRHIHLMDYIELGERVQNQGIEHSESVLADAFEALIGAVYLDKGFVKCREIICSLYEKNVDFEDLFLVRDNYKSILLELVQAKKLSAPIYRVVRETGPGHEKIFDVEVIVNNKVLGKGIGKNKKKAEQEAAMNALNALDNIN